MKERGSERISMIYQLFILHGFQHSEMRKPMNEGTATNRPVIMEQNDHHDVSQAAHLPVPPGKQASPEDELVGQCSGEIPADEVAAMRELAIAARKQMQKKGTPLLLVVKYHRKTGRIRTPRETSDSGESMIPRSNIYSLS
jgi:hypothetical protein